MEIRYAKHLQTRLELRHIDAGLPGYIFEKADERFKDRVTGHFIAVKTILIYDVQREVMVAYEEKDEIIILLTIHPLKKGQKYNRVSTGRWQRL